MFSLVVFVLVVCKIFSSPKRVRRSVKLISQAGVFTVAAQTSDVISFDIFMDSQSVSLFILLSLTQKDAVPEYAVQHLGWLKCLINGVSVTHDIQVMTIILNKTGCLIRIRKKNFKDPLIDHWTYPPVGGEWGVLVSCGWGLLHYANVTGQRTS